MKAAPRRGTTLTARFAFVAVAAVAITGAALFAVDHYASRIGIPRPFALAATLLASAGVAAWIARAAARPHTLRLSAIEDGLLGFRDGDFSLQVVAGADDEMRALVTTFNAVARDLQSRRSETFEKEMLLDTILQASPMAMLLANAGGRVVFANQAARTLLGEGRRLEGRRVAEILESLPPALRELIEAGAESLFKSRSGDQDETFRFVHREFYLNTQKHTLMMFERLTPELRRQELAVWKRAIRTMNHELNNSIAPISSLVHSARLASGRPEHARRLDEIYATIEEQLGRLRAFLEAYAEFARLPDPRKERVAWRHVLDELQRLYPFRIESAAGVGDGNFDRAQIEHVLINLLKNAQESGSPAGEIVLTLSQTAEATTLRVLDRGCGMPDSVMRQALLPFYSTKPEGTGLGLALASEIVEAHGGWLTLQRRECGGSAVTVVLPNG